MKHKEKWKMVFKTHDGEWHTHSTYDYKECVGFKDKLINAYTCSEIKIFHYELVGLNIGQPRCVYNAEGLISLETAIEDVERMSPHMF
tara:strand:+ start:428 stop:691 length:264 start_codon:yes stop_codon:yes gene_type:complete